MNRVELAVERFSSGFACSQAVLSVFAEPLGVDAPTAAKIAAGFGGGMGRMAETCGAVTGAMMVLGLRHGPAVGEDRATREKVYQLVRQFADRFRARNGTLICRDLLGCDIGTPEGAEVFRQKQLAATVCPKFVRDAVEIVEGLW